MVGDYNIRGPSGYRTFSETPAHSHLIPTCSQSAITLPYRSLRNDRCSIRNLVRNRCQKKVRKTISMHFRNVTHRKIERRGQRKRRSKRWIAYCGEIVYALDAKPIGVCSSPTGGNRVFIGLVTGHQPAVITCDRIKFKELQIMVIN